MGIKDEGNPFKYSDGSWDWVVIIVVALFIAAFTGILGRFMDDGPTNVPPGERPCVEQMTNSC